jgi:hypothetical protein
MSVAYVTEFAQLMPSPVGGQGQIAMQPAIASTAVSFTATHGESAAFNAATRLVRIHVDGIASVQFGTAPTAVAGTDFRMAAGQTEYFGVPPGGSYKVSFVTASA